MASASSSRKDFLESISPGSPQDLLLSTRSCKDLLERNFAGSSQEPFYARIYNENAAGPELENPAAHLHSLNAQHERLTRAIFWRELTGKMPRPHTLCVHAQSKLIWTSPGIILRENSQGKSWGPRSSQNCDPHCVRACAIEMHIDIAQSHFYARMYNKNSGHQRAYPDLTLP